MGACFPRVLENIKRFPKYHDRCNPEYLGKMDRSSLCINGTHLFKRRRYTNMVGLKPWIAGRKVLLVSAGVQKRCTALLLMCPQAFRN